MSHHFHKLSVKNITRETADTVSVSFTVPEELTNEFKYKAGQYVTLRKEINGEDIRRSYSICTAPFENELRVAIKQVDNGVFSTFATTSLKEGDILEVMAPEGNFKIEPIESESGNYIFYAAGSGITPVLSMIKSLLKNEPQSKVFLYYGNRTAADTIFKNQLDALASGHSNFSLHYILSREETGNAITNGRIDESKCAHFWSTEQIDLKIAGIYACGPQEMIECVEDFYAHKGILHKVHFELFKVKAPVQTSVPSGENVNAKVTVIIDDESIEFDLATNGTNILQAAQDADADVPFSCKGGVCCTCKAKVLEGSAKMDVNYALDDHEVEEGFILTCQAHPTSEKVVVSYDEY